MFEPFVAFKYLLPRKRSLSAALISLISILVISLVVWLVLVFLSVTTGIEKKWLKGLTSLNAPVRIAPTKAYYSSYYYQIDNLSSSSGYSFKTIGEKAESDCLDPYKNDMDIELPYHMPKNANIDLVKKAYSVLDTFPKINYQDYEMSGALLKLTLLRDDRSQFSFSREKKTSYLSQMSYLLSLMDKSPNLYSLFLEPKAKDINHVLETQVFSQDEVKSFFSQIEVKTVETTKDWQMPLNLLEDNTSYQGFAAVKNGKVFKIFLLKDSSADRKYVQFLEGSLVKKDGGYAFISKEKQYLLEDMTSISLDAPITFKTKLINNSIDAAKRISHVQFNVEGIIQGKKIKGILPFADMDIELFELVKNSSPLFWATQNDGKIQLPVRDGKQGVILPKALRKSGALIGDEGHLIYTIQTATSMTEQRLPVFVAGFYDPGLFPVGSRFIIVPNDITRIINSSVATFSPDATPTNGIYLWTNDLSQVDNLKQMLEKKLQDAKISPYWQVETYKDYEFSKDMMQQFQSDRLLFTLVAIIVLIVACSNIISLLILLVHDKKREIAVMQALGATKKSIAYIFGLCGVIMGAISSVIGTVAAYFTLKHIDIVARLLSAVQGHSAFNAVFFGESLPSQMSFDALLLVLIATPIISFVAGLIPAIKATKLSPSSTLRSQ